MSFGQHFERYAVLARAAGKAESTIRTELKCHRTLWIFLDDMGFEGTEVDVRKADLEQYAQWVNWLPNLRETTKGTRLKAIRPFYNEAVRREWMLVNPMEDITQPKSSEPPVITLSVEQIKALVSQPDLDTGTGIRDRAMLELLFSCVFRRSELLALTRNDFSDDLREVRFTGKGGKEAVLPVSKHAAHFLSFYLAEMWSRINVRGLPQLWLAFKTGRPICAGQLERLVRNYGQQAGIVHPVTPHAFRYSLATILSDDGAQVKHIKEYLRHDFVNTTLRYIKKSFKQLQEVHRASHPRA